MRLRFTLTFVAVALATAAFAQDTGIGSSPDVFQVRYAANLNIGDSVVNITNSGTSGSNICVNVYTFDQSEEMVSCCSCLVTPDGLVSLSAQGDLVSNTLSPATPVNIVIKLVATEASSTTGCSAGTVGTLAPGMRAWGTTLHALPPLVAGNPSPYGVTETAFLPGGLSSEEQTYLTTFCNFINTNGSGFGLCKSCRAGGLGGARAN